MTTFSIFDRAGNNVEDKLFDTLAAAQDHAKNTTYEDHCGFYPVHAGQNCPEHDEHEAGNCRYCGTKKPIDESLESYPSLRVVLNPVTRFHVVGMRGLFFVYDRLNGDTSITDEGMLYSSMAASLADRMNNGI